MPNWCSNNVEFHNDDVAEVAKLEAHLKFLDSRKKGEHAEAGLFAYFVPRPPEEEDSWYEWNVSNWGTKWEASIYSWTKVNDNSITMNFDTAWSPPTALYEFLAANTEWYVTATYYEPGMSFVGSNVGGYDDCYTIENLEALDAVPEELLEEYNIREQMEDWEEESEDEPDTDLVSALEDLKKEFEALSVSDEPAKHAFDDETGREWLRELLRERVVGVVFTKKDGTERVMQATLSENLIPETQNSEKSATTRKKSDEALAVWDIEAEGWRSFRWDSVKTINFSLGE
jgi:hypothetical protein